MIKTSINRHDIQYYLYAMAKALHNKFSYPELMKKLSKASLSKISNNTKSKKGSFGNNSCSSSYSKSSFSYLSKKSLDTSCSLI